MHGTHSVSFGYNRGERSSHDMGTSRHAVSCEVAYLQAYLHQARAHAPRLREDLHCCKILDSFAPPGTPPLLLCHCANDTVLLHASLGCRNVVSYWLRFPASCIHDAIFVTSNLLPASAPAAAGRRYLTVQMVRERDFVVGVFIIVASHSVRRRNPCSKSVAC